MQSPTFPWPGSIAPDPIAQQRERCAEAERAVERGRRALALVEARAEQERARLLALEARGGRLVA